MDMPLFRDKTFKSRYRQKGQNGLISEEVATGERKHTASKSF